jgi:hypothetical protein
MSSSLPPDERARIAEEQHIRNQENVALAKEVVKEGGKMWLKIILIVFGVGIAFVICYLVALGGVCAAMFGSMPR